jgi:protein SCO1/2
VRSRDPGRVAALWLVVAAACARQEAPSAAPAATRGVDTAAATVAGSPRRFPNPLLTTHEGREVRFYDDLVRGKVVMLSFSYTQCKGACPRSTRQLVAVQRLLGERFGRDVTLLTLSLDPENDTPEAMRRYVEAHDGRPGWTWLTGRGRDIEAIRRFIGFTDPDPVRDADRTQHTTLVAIGDDRTGRWSHTPVLVRPELIVETVLRTAGEGRAAAKLAAACVPTEGRTPTGCPGALAP